MIQLHARLHRDSEELFTSPAGQDYWKCAERADAQSHLDSMPMARGRLSTIGNDNADRVTATEEILDRLLLAVQRLSSERRLATLSRPSIFHRADIQRPTSPSRQRKRIAVVNSAVQLMVRGVSFTVLPRRRGSESTVGS